MKHPLVRTRILFVRGYRRARNARARSRITHVISIASRCDLPEDLHPRCIYLLGGTTPKWGLLDCPCGRGHSVELNLANPAKTRWTITTNRAGQPSIYPSIDYQGEPRCHYWVRNGRIHWVQPRLATEPTST